MVLPRIVNNLSIT